MTILFAFILFPIVFGILILSIILIYVSEKVKHCRLQKKYANGYDVTVNKNVRQDIQYLQHEIGAVKYRVGLFLRDRFPGCTWDFYGQGITEIATSDVFGIIIRHPNGQVTEDAVVCMGNRMYELKSVLDKEEEEEKKRAENTPQKRALNWLQNHFDELFRLEKKAKDKGNQTFTIVMENELLSDETVIGIIIDLLQEKGYLNVCRVKDRGSDVKNRIRLGIPMEIQL